MSRYNDEVREWNHLIRAGTPVYGIYCVHATGTWVTGRLQRVRRRSALVWHAQPWGSTTWAELKSYRQVWVEAKEAP